MSLKYEPSSEPHRYRSLTREALLALGPLIRPLLHPHESTLHAASRTLKPLPYLTLESARAHQIDERWWEGSKQP